jgi:hypothetical protein
VALAFRRARHFRVQCDAQPICLQNAEVCGAPDDEDARSYAASKLVKHGWRVVGLGRKGERWFCEHHRSAE